MESVRLGMALLRLAIGVPAAVEGRRSPDPAHRYRSSGRAEGGAGAPPSCTSSAHPLPGGPADQLMTSELVPVAEAMVMLVFPPAAAR